MCIKQALEMGPARQRPATDAPAGAAAKRAAVAGKNNATVDSPPKAQPAADESSSNEGSATPPSEGSVNGNRHEGKSQNRQSDHQPNGYSKDADANV
jgi:hypothetical protein